MQELLLEAGPFTDSFSLSNLITSPGLSTLGWGFTTWQNRRFLPLFFLLENWPKWDWGGLGEALLTQAASRHCHLYCWKEGSSKYDSFLVGMTDQDVITSTIKKRLAHFFENFTLFSSAVKIRRKWWHGRLFLKFFCSFFSDLSFLLIYIKFYLLGRKPRQYWFFTHFLFLSLFSSFRLNWHNKRPDDFVTSTATFGKSLQLKSCTLTSLLWVGLGVCLQHCFSCSWIFLCVWHLPFFSLNQNSRTLTSDFLVFFFFFFCWAMLKSESVLCSALKWLCIDDHDHRVFYAATVSVYA